MTAEAASPPASAIVFLHLPKTAGQSVHAYLERLFGAETISPARINRHLAAMTIAELRRHRVHSGHFDWTLLDCLPRPAFVFSIFRDPLDRLLSLYFFLRREEQRRTPAAAGPRSICALSPDDYLASPNPQFRAARDQDFDNFYTYFLAGRTIGARRRLLDLPDHQRSDARLLDMALENLTQLNGAYTTSTLDRLEQDLLRQTPNTAATGLAAIRANQGDSATRQQRLEQLRALGATAVTFDRLEEMTRLDRVIWAHVAGA